MLLWEDAERFRKLSGEDPEETSIARISGFLDGYEKGKACTQSCTESQCESVQEIIRCKDCKFAHLTYDGDCKYCQYLIDNFDVYDSVYFDGDDYCSHAERRADE